MDRLKINRELLVYKAFYFFFLSGLGALFPYLPVYFRQMGLPASNVGLLIGFRPIAQFASAPFWAVMADKYRKRKAILIMSALAWLIMTLALAFVEPTHEICEVRKGNSSDSHFVNYTKIKTGFFKRSVVSSAVSAEYRVAENEVQASPDLVVVPLKPDFQSHQSRRLFTNNTANDNTTTNGSPSEHKEMINQLVVATRKTTYSRHTNPSNDERTGHSSHIEKTKLTDTVDNGRKYFEMGTATYSSHTNGNNVSYVTDIANSRRQRKITYSKSKQFDQVLTTFENSSRNRVNDTLTNNNNTRNNTERTITPAKNTGTIIINANKTKDQQHTSTRRNKLRSQPDLVEFSKENFASNLDESYDGPFSFSGISGELPNKENTVMWGASSSRILNKVARKTKKESNYPKVWSSADLKKRGKKDGSNVEADNKAVGIRHFSEMIKSISQELEVSGDAGSASMFAYFPAHKLANMLLKHKDDSKSVDSLHHNTIENSNKNVIHHSVKDILTAVNSAQDGLTGSSSLHALAEKVQLSDDRSVHGNNEQVGLGESANGDLVGSSYTNTKMSTSGNNPKVYNPRNFHGSGLNIGESSGDPEKLNDSPSITLDEPPSSPTQEVSKQESLIFMVNLTKSNPNELGRIFTILLVLIVVGEFLESPCVTLADASLLEMLGEERRFYGKQRLWGSVGFGIFSFVVGVLLERSQTLICGYKYTDYMICFCFFGILMLLTLLVSSGFQFRYFEVKTNTTSAAIAALCNVHYGSCMIAACIMGVNYGMCHNFLVWFLEDLGASKTLMGIAIISRCFADTLTFYVAGTIIKALGQVRIMIAVLLSYAVVFQAYTLLENPWYVIPVEVLNGVTYALAWSACTSYLVGAGPHEAVTTIQGILQGVYWGLGTGTGTIAGGYLIHHLGPVSAFRLTAVLSLLMGVLFCGVQWKWTLDVIPVEFPQTKYSYLPTVATKDTEALLSGHDMAPAPSRRCYKKVKLNSKIHRDF
ncbi:uncharacterized protein LOC5509111 [Nematostella vectensis]|uniref:uncharacterized protein LOC5509111 n=1 Tax=Nematostella vectensis TaxID=45351 RepID=UPI002077352F|nr:uncharacterized protein LOC5509111 [Nematostella vectensis]